MQHHPSLLGDSSRIILGGEKKTWTNNHTKKRGSMVIVTSGGAYTDIDAFGGCVAYADLLRRTGVEASAVLEPPLNASVPSSLRGLAVAYDTQYSPDAQDRYVLIDVSDEAVFAPYVTHARIQEIIDHHPGFETFWADHGVKTQIEVVGAACTQVFEHWEAAGKTAELDSPTAKLLMAGILDNTLGFKAHITTDRDHTAYKKLQATTGDDGTFMATYFKDCQTGIEQNLADAIQSDVKNQTFPGFGPLKTGQLAVWDGSDLIDHRFQKMVEAMGIGKPWFLNLINIDEGRSLLVTTDPQVSGYLTNLLQVTFDAQGIGRADRLWLRKEILKVAIDTHGAVV